MNEKLLLPALKILQLKKCQQKFVTDKSGVKLVEILDYHQYFDPSQPYLEFPGRKTSETYVKNELDWYYSMDLSVDFIGEKAKIWKQIASDKNIINSNYGWCIFSEDNGFQYQNCYAELVKNPESRRAIMIYTRPSMHTDYCKDNMNDFICTNTVQCFIRDNQLHYFVYMRSNDAIFGFFNDLVWHCHVYQKLLVDLQKVYPHFTSAIDGLHWCAASFHVYERHFDMLDKMCDYDIA